MTDHNTTTARNARVKAWAMLHERLHQRRQVELLRGQRDRLHRLLVKANARQDVPVTTRLRIAFMMVNKTAEIVRIATTPIPRYPEGGKPAYSFSIAGSGPELISKLRSLNSGGSVIAVNHDDTVHLLDAQMQVLPKLLPEPPTTFKMELKMQTIEEHAKIDTDSFNKLTNPGWRGRRQR